jgi:hypothetical protein
MQVTKMKMQTLKGQNHEGASDAGWVFALQLTPCGLFMTIGFHSKIIFI